MPTLCKLDPMESSAPVEDSKEIKLIVILPMTETVYSWEPKNPDARIIGFYDNRRFSVLCPEDKVNQLLFPVGSTVVQGESVTFF